MIRVVGKTERAELDCRWAGSIVTKHRLTRPVRRFEQLEHFDELLARITGLRAQDATAQQIADTLNIEGWRPPKKQAFDAPMVCRLLQRHHLGSKRPIWSGAIPHRGEDEVTLQELADHLGAHRQTVYGWLRLG